MDPILLYFLLLYTLNCYFSFLLSKNPKKMQMKRYFLDNTSAQQQQDTTDYSAPPNTSQDESQSLQRQRQRQQNQERHEPRRATKSLFDRQFPFQSSNQRDETDEMKQYTSSSSSSKSSSPPDGVPSIRNWKVLEDGGISGLIYGSVNAEDGDYIETSGIVYGTFENGNVVETSSGSRYFLSDETADNTAMNILNAFKNFSSGNRRKGTITINKENSINDQINRRRQKESVMEILERGPPRSTFSLFDLFGASAGDSPSNPKDATPASPPPPPPPDKAPPSGVPTLSGWKVNDDNTITGYVFGSPKIGDGNLITTSAIARGERKQYEIVATISGSLYFLG
jgi:hypothetical protein